METRPVCAECHLQPAAVNYRRQDKVYYRRLCDTCITKKKKIRPPVPGWVRSGYKKKGACDRCGFRAKYKEQLGVYHVDGNRHNSTASNLKTVCLNCAVEIGKLKAGWAPADLIPDY